MPIPANTHQFAWPCVARFSLATAKRRFVPFPFISRTVQVSSDQAVSLSFAPSDAARVAATEVPVAAGVAFADVLQVSGLWVVNESGETADVCIFAVLGPDPAAGWPTYTAANGYDGVDTALDFPAAVDLE